MWIRLQIRRAVPDDVERLSTIARAAKAHWGYPRGWLAAWEPSLRVTPEHLQRQLVFVAAEGQELIGFYALADRDDRWSLEHFWVEPSRHRRGAGRRLFAHALDTVRQIRPGVVIIESDPFAAGFYAHMGARQTGSVAAPVEGDPDRRLPVFEVEVTAHHLESSVTVATARLLLRPWREEDETELHRLFSDPAVRGGRHFPPDRIARFADGSLRQWRVNGFGPWAAIHKTTGAWIGRIGLDELEDWPGVDKIEVGFELHRAWWGRGLATEGALAALRFGFEQLGLERIISVTAAAHVAARRVMEKAGLVYEGTRIWMNPQVSVVWYSLDRARWKARAL